MNNSKHTVRLDGDAEIFKSWDEMEEEMRKACKTCKFGLERNTTRLVCYHCDGDLKNWEPAQPDNTPDKSNDLHTSDMQSEDKINNPNHYTFRGGIEPIDFIRSNNLTFTEGSIVKYIYRHPAKDNPIEDLKKARRNIDWMIADLEKQQAALET